MMSIKKAFILLLCGLLAIPAMQAAVALAAPTETITVYPDESRQQVEGWGTSLAWWANIVGGWSSANRNAIADLLFDPTSGLGLNIVRYNIGGGDDPSHDHMRDGAEVPGYQPSPGVWDWTADANQRWVLAAAVARGADITEAISYSPPYWMTVSGCTTGSASGGNNLMASYYDDYVEYIAEVAEHFKDYWGTTFDYVTPLNEPIETYWIEWGYQEGNHFDLDKQNDILQLLQDALDARNLTSQLTGPDEYYYENTIDDYKSYDASVQASIAKLNTHGYGGTDRSILKSLAEKEGKKLWMSEWTTGGIVHSHTAMGPALEMAERIITDMNVLQPSAWVIWDAVEEEEENDKIGQSYGLIHANYEDSSDYYVVARQYYAMGQFSKFIKPGFTIIGTDSNDTLAAFDEASGDLVVVHRNSSQSDKNITIDLSSFDSVNATAGRTRTSATETLGALSDLTLNQKTLSAVAKAESITTYVFSNAVYTGGYQHTFTINDNTIAQMYNSFNYTGTWGYYNAEADAFQQDNHYSNITNDYYTVEFLGSKVHLYGSKAPNAGIAAISIDGGSETWVDLYAPARSDNIVLYSSPELDYDVHTLKVRVTGLKNGGSSNYYIPADRADVLVNDVMSVNNNKEGTGVNEFHYVGNWIYTYQPGAFADDNHYAYTAGDYYEVGFNGTRIEVYGSVAPNAGIAAMSIDGGSETMVDLYAAVRSDNVKLWESPVLAEGAHTLKVRVTGNKNPSSGNYIVPADRVDIHNIIVVNDNDNGTGTYRFEYNGEYWGYYGEQTGAFRNDNHYSNIANDDYRVEFNGIGIKVYGPAAPNQGKAAFSIDGGAEMIVDLYAGQRVENLLLWQSPALPPGTHTLKVRVTGQKNILATDYIVPADRVVITQ